MIGIGPPNPLPEHKPIGARFQVRSALKSRRWKLENYRRQFDRRVFRTIVLEPLPIKGSAATDTTKFLCRHPSTPAARSLHLAAWPPTFAEHRMRRRHE